MSNPACWGIFREPAHSPGRESDDELILRATADRLSALGYEPRLVWPEESEALLAEARPRVFLMCERPPILAALAECGARGGVLVNSPRAIRNTYRQRMAMLFREAGIPFPAHRFVPTSAPVAARGPLWVKRGDVHNTTDGDVAFAAGAEEASRILGEMAGRGIAHAMLQEHVAGDLIKFYGIGDPSRPGIWFNWFYHKGQDLAGHPFEPSLLSRIAFRAAAALGLEVFGGDAIATARGEVSLIDLNAWPSFALFREEAARRIAAHLAMRFAEAEARLRA